MIKLKVGSKIKQMRLNRGLTQAELAKILGVSRPTISSWEVDRTEPSMQDIQRMAQVFVCPVEDLISKKYREDLIRDCNMQRVIELVSEIPNDKLELVIRYLEYVKWEAIEETKKNGKV